MDNTENLAAEFAEHAAPQAAEAAAHADADAPAAHAEAAAHVQAAPQAAHAEAIPAAVDTAQVQKVVVDAEGAFAAVKGAIKEEADTAISAAGKLLSTAAGNAHSALSDAEAAAISIVVHNAPPQYQGVVSAFASSVASLVEGTLNPVADAAVQRGLAWSLAWLKAGQSVIDHALS